jgi:hypothetical protein
MGLERSFTHFLAPPFRVHRTFSKTTVFEGWFGWCISLDFCTRRVIRFGRQVRLLSLTCLSADESAPPQLTPSGPKILCNQRKRAERRDLRAPVYGWFTEGFDTAEREVGRFAI